MLLVELELGRVLDGDDALVGWDERGHDVEHRRLTGTRPTGDQDVGTGHDASLEEADGFVRDSAEVDEVLVLVWVAGELPDGEHRSVQRDRRDDRVDTRSVQQP